MTRYFIPKDPEPSTAVAGVRRMTVYAYTGDSAPIPDYYDEVQLVPADAIVIRREELPEVDVWFPGTADESLRTKFTQVTPSRSGPDLIADLEQEARERLAIAAHLREHPPVDEAQVQLFSKALIEAGMDDVDGPTPTTVARRMAERYRIEVTP